MLGHVALFSHPTLDHHQTRARAGGHGLRQATVLALLALAGNGLGGCAGAKIADAEGASGGASGGATGPGRTGNGGATQVTIDPIPTITPSSVDAESTSRVVGCDGGDGCVCPTLNVAVVGNPGVWGDGFSRASGTTPTTGLGGHSARRRLRPSRIGSRTRVAASSP